LAFTVQRSAFSGVWRLAGAVGGKTIGHSFREI
jgi:hypothetical protein